MLATLSPVESAESGELVELRARNERLEQELEQANTRYALILEASNDGVWDWDVVSGECFFSKRWKSILNYEEHEIADNAPAFFALIHEGDRARVDAAVKAHFRRESIYDVEFRMLAKGGGIRIIRARGQAVWDEQGQPVRMAGTHTDVTVHRREAKARARERALIEVQRATIQALGTPVLELGGGVLCVPIIGSVDQERAERMTGEVLNTVVDGAARAVIIDLTAAEVDGQETLTHLIQMLRAVALIGAEGSVCGLSPRLAQRMVEDELSFDGVPVYRNLGDALRGSQTRGGAAAST